MRKEVDDISRDVSCVDTSSSYLDDLTYIKSVKHTPNGNVWHQYDIQLDARPYGWEDTIKWADYMASSDLSLVTQVSVCNIGATDYDITKEYNSNNKKCEGLLELKTEYGMLGFAGLSKIVNAPMKIVWINQTNTFRLFTTISD